MILLTGGVCSRGCLLWGVCSGLMSAPGGCLLPGGVSALGGPGGGPPGMATAAGGTHLTGMHSCFIMISCGLNFT